MSKRQTKDAKIRAKRDQQRAQKRARRAAEAAAKARLDAFHAKLGNPMVIAMQGAALAINRDEVIANNAQLLDLLRTGQMTDKRSYDRLTMALLMAENLRRFGLANDHGDTFEAAFDALVEIGKRKVGRDHYVARGPELDAIDLALTVHAVQMRNASVREIEEAQRIVVAQQMTIQGRKAA